MYQEIKKLAEEALKLQNKNLMEESLHKIVVVCDAMEPMKSTGLSESVLEELATKMQQLISAGIPVAGYDGADFAPKPNQTYERVTYGFEKQFDSEAEMIADIQGVPSPVFPIKEVPVEKSRTKKGGAK